MTAGDTQTQGRRRQQAAADPARSAWVSANAGAGKTHVLVDRVLRLMLAGARPEAILCLTFTKAAAAEMANRLHRELAHWATAGNAALGVKLQELAGRDIAADQLKPARRLFAQTLDAPGGLRIQTIHAFCQSLLGRFPLEAGVPPHFQVMDERTAAELATAVQAELLAGAQHPGDCDLNAALDGVVRLIDETAFGDLMREMLNRRGRLQALLAKHGGDLDRAIGATRAALGLGEAESTEMILAHACADTAIDGAGLARACAALDGGSSNDQVRAEQIRQWLNSFTRRSAQFDPSYIDIYLTKEKRSPRKESGLITKAAQKKDPAARETLLAEQQRVFAVVQKLRAARVAEATAALWRVGLALIGRYDDAKARMALLDYQDLILRTRDLLDRPGVAPWVLYKLDGGIDHILVDEAQDTSPEQWAVIAKLAEEFFTGEGARKIGRTVFAVGDEKQSIYSFQGADPAAFEGMRAYFAARVGAAGATFDSIDLTLSFRSTETILRAVDAVFAQSAAMPGVATPTRLVRHAAKREGHAGLIEVWPTEKPTAVDNSDPWDAPVNQVSEQSPMARLARRIADTIAEWLNRREILESVDRPIRPGDILILVRRRNAFVEHMVRALKQRKIAVAGADRMVLTEQIAVMDLIALGRFVLLPEDELNLASVLKGPLFGFDDELLFALSHGREARLWTTLERRRDERVEFAAAYAELAALRARADFTPPFEFYAELLGQGRGRVRMLGRLGVEADDPIDEFLALALAHQRGRAPSLESFLHWLEAGGTEVKRDMEQGRDEVRVMTVHGAKGLEANVVFLPDTCSVPDARHDDRILWQPNIEPPLFYWPVRSSNDEAAVAAARSFARERRLDEHRRLLYVAMTRARDRLYVGGYEGKKGRAEGCWYDLIRGGLEPLAEAIPQGDHEPSLRLRSRQIAIPETIATAATSAAAAPLPQWAMRPASNEPVPPKPLVPSRPDGEEPAVVSPLAEGDSQRFLRGRLIHRLLQTLPDLAPADRGAAAARFLQRFEHGLDAAARAEIAAVTLRLFDHPEIAELFGPGSRAEVPIAGLVGNRAISGQIDRLLVSMGKVVVADYKSNRPAPATPSEVPYIYLKQMALYRNALAEIYPDRPVEALLIWSDGPRVMRLPVEMLTVMAP